MGAGLAVIDHMLLMLRDLQITTQCLFALPQYVNNFAATNSAHETMPLWGAVLDMGGETNLRRPQYLAEQLANRAILPTMLRTQVTGAPTWTQPQSSNDKIALRDAETLQTFAFASGPNRSLILLNLSRTSALPVTFTGALAPRGKVEETRLAAASLTATNEQTEQVRTSVPRVVDFNPAVAYALPPYSMTVLRWVAAR